MHIFDLRLFRSLRRSLYGKAANRYLSAKQASAFTEALKTNKHLKVLRFQKTNLKPAGAAKFAEMLKVNNVLTHLDLRNSMLKDEGVIALAEALKTNTALTALDLADGSDSGDHSVLDGERSNKFTSKAVIAVIKALMVKTTSMEHLVVVPGDIKYVDGITK